MTQPKWGNGLAGGALVTMNDTGARFGLQAAFRIFASVIWCGWLAGSMYAQGTYFVDCSGTDVHAFSSIGAALGVAGPNSVVLVTGTCNENVYIYNAMNLSLGAFAGQTATLNGGMNVFGSSNVFLYGLIVTNPGGDAFAIGNSHNVMLSGCSGKKSLGRGLSINGLSDVSVDGPASFDGNGNGGVLINGGSVLFFSPFSAPAEIRGNAGAGVWLSSGSLFSVLGSTSIAGNLSSPSPGVGIQSHGGAKVQIGACVGAVDISGNQDGGIYTDENSELSLFDCGNPAGISVNSNGPVGISAGLGSQVTLYNNVQILGHSVSGVELYGKSQLNGFGTFVISGNGSGGNQRSAGIVADGNSEVYVRGGQVKGNTGPGILALVNSSADVVGASFNGNSGGIATCDSSAYLVSDLLSGPGKPQAGILCRTPHNLGNRKGTFSAPVAPDLTLQKARLAAYKALARR